MPDTRLQRLNVLILSTAVTALLVGYFEFGALFVQEQWNYMNRWR